MRLLKVFSHTENIHLLFKITKCWFKSQAMIFESRLYSDKILMQKAQIKLAKGVIHRLFDINETFSKMIFGENLLVTSRNIANKEVLRSEEDRQCYIDLRNLLTRKISEKDLVSLIGIEESFLIGELMENLSDFEPKSASCDGVCFSACMFIIGNLLNEPEINENILIHHISELQKGVPAKVAAIQQVYGDLKINNNVCIRLILNETFKNTRSTFCNNIIDIIFERTLQYGMQMPKNLTDQIQLVLNNALKAVEEISFLNYDYFGQKYITRDSIIKALCPDIIKNNEREKIQYLNANVEIYKNVDSEIKMFIEKALNSLTIDYFQENYKSSAVAHLYGFKLDFEGNSKLLSLLGEYKNKNSSLEHLKDLGLLEPGIYQTSFKTTDNGHAVLYVKTKLGDSFIFDPNYGLIKCDQDNPLNTFLKLLSLYPPPSTRLTNENDDRNYRVKLTKYNKSMINLQQVSE